MESPLLALSNYIFSAILSSSLMVTYGNPALLGREGKEIVYFLNKIVSIGVA